MAYNKKLLLLLTLLLVPVMTMNASIGLVCPDGVTCSAGLHVPGLTMNASTGLVCSDGVICDGDPGCTEKCDDGDLNADAPNACRTDCTLPVCGDGIIDDAAPYNEECDDMNLTDSDGCDSLCQLEEVPPLCYNSLDDDEDGATDCADPSCNGAAGAADSCGVGACAATGTQVCQDGQTGSTCTPGTPVAEACGDSIDNDCDGGVDEVDECPIDLCTDFTSQPTSCGVGVCAAEGVTACDPASGEIGDTCVEGVSGPEICDGLDNDCDGSVDDGIAATPTSCGVGACAATGEASCVDGQTVDACAPGTPTEEVCGDSIDNDCDGGVDEVDECPIDLCIDFTSQPTSCGVGVCAAKGVTACDPASGEIGDTCVEGVSGPEICDGLDNDCDGNVDDGITATPTSCGVGACAATGEASCVDGQTVDACAPGTPTEEVCGDSIDNDCDGGVDDLPSCTELCIGFESQPTSCGVGVCAAEGVTACDPASGEIGDTCVEGISGPEICDGLDNDCDGNVDDGITATPTSCGVGACAATGEASCVDGQTVDACAPGTPTEEVCGDSIDNDCDGGVDDLPSCTELCIGFESQPTSCGVGVCAAKGVTACDPASGEIGDTCVEGVSGPEICDGLDNDCNGSVDDGIAATPTSCGVGACAAEGQTTCEAGVAVDSCTPGTPTEEVCSDGIDNDCDGGVDDLPGCTEFCIDFEPQPTSCGVGVCAATGATSCDSATGKIGDSCVAGTPGTEICDGLDNDCNGSVDDGIAATPTSCGVGACAATGEASCVDGQTVDACAPGAPTEEVCGDGIDNDCDGGVDNLPGCTDLCIGFKSQPTSCGVGVCAATGTTTCDFASGEIGDTCVEGVSGPEICDGLDNDCDGIVDEVADCRIIEVERCDVDGDGDVDIFDVRAIMAARNSQASGPNDSRDANGDGTITVNDGRQCVRQCTKPRCAPEDI